MVNARKWMAVLLVGVLLVSACAPAAPTAAPQPTSAPEPAAPPAQEGFVVGYSAAGLIGGASLSGGAGSVVGTLAGVLILGMISNGLNLLHVDPYYQYVVKGLIILFAILMDQWGRK